MDEVGMAPPKVLLVGVGGTGINLTKKVFDHVKHMSPMIASVGYDFADERHKYDGESNVEVFGEGRGAGKDRKFSIGLAVQYVNQMNMTRFEEADVIIVMFSLAGASGSTLGPNIIKRCAKLFEDKPIIAVVYGDASSEDNATNSKNTISTLYNVANNNNIYLPLMVFNVKSPYHRQNEVIVKRTVNLIGVLNQDAAGVDTMDKLKWLKPTHMASIETGLKFIHISVGNTTQDGSNYLPDDVPTDVEVWSYPDAAVIDSMMNIIIEDPKTKDAKHVLLPIDTVRSRASYQGVFQPTDSDYPSVGLITSTNAAFDRYVGELDDTINAFRTTVKTKTVIKNINPSADDMVV